MNCTLYHISMFMTHTSQNIFKFYAWVIKYVHIWWNFSLSTFCKFQFESTPVENKKGTNKTQKIAAKDESGGNTSARNHMHFLTKATKAISRSFDCLQGSPCLTRLNFLFEYHVHLHYFRAPVVQKLEVREGQLCVEVWQSLSVTHCTTFRFNATLKTSLEIVSPFILNALAFVTLHQIHNTILRRLCCFLSLEARGRKNWLLFWSKPLLTLGFSLQWTSIPAGGPLLQDSIWKSAFKSPALAWPFWLDFCGNFLSNHFQLREFPDNCKVEALQEEGRAAPVLIKTKAACVSGPACCTGLTMQGPPRHQLLNPPGLSFLNTTKGMLLCAFYFPCQSGRRWSCPMFAFECGVPSRKAKLSSPKAGQPRVASQYKWAARSSCRWIPGSTGICCHSELRCLSRDGLVIRLNSGQASDQTWPQQTPLCSGCLQQSKNPGAPWKKRNEDMPVLCLPDFRSFPCSVGHMDFISSLPFSVVVPLQL